MKEQLTPEDLRQFWLDIVYVFKGGSVGYIEEEICTDFIQRKLDQK